MEQQCRPAAIITPPIDAVCGGGLSIVVACLIIAYGWLAPIGVGRALVAIEVYLLSDLLINWPHFIASYRILYAKRSNFVRHPLVTIVVPLVAAICLGYLFFAPHDMSNADESGPFFVIRILEWLAPVFLGWHYTGQSWGMTACQSYLAGLRMSPTERRLIRSGLYALFIYHIAWVYNSIQFVHGLWPEEEAGVYIMKSAMSFCRAILFITFALGIVGFRRLAKREGKAIPVRVWLPWAATFSWYVMIDVNPAAFFLLQAFHAFQYLTFPIRVELNEHAKNHNKWVHLTIYYVVLVVLGFVFFDWHNWLFDMSESELPIVTASIITLNLHHYLTDAVIWKIREPEVRKSLFCHLETAETRP